MLPAAFQQAIGNVCLGIAALLYALPLQHLLWEMSHKRDDGGGAMAGLIILVPMWLLLMAALFCVAASGGFDWLGWHRAWVYALLLPVTMSLAVFSFARFESLPLASRVSRRVVGALTHVLALLTMALVVLNLNRGLAPDIPLVAVNLPWIICAALTLALCSSYVGYRATVARLYQFRAIAHRFRLAFSHSKETLAQIATLDPKRDFNDLARRIERHERRTIRDAALARLRCSAAFVETLIAALNSATAPSGELDHALTVVAFAEFSPDEKKRIAEPARNAMTTITRYIRSELRYFTPDRRKHIRSWGTQLFEAIAAKFADTGLDFQPALDAFEQTLNPAKSGPDNP